MSGFIQTPATVYVPGAAHIMANSTPKVGASLQVL